MTCINCKYQWCWLCEGEYKYGHYDSGRCKDQWFVIADYPKEIKDDNNYNNNNYNNFNNNNNNLNNLNNNRNNRNNIINRNNRKRRRNFFSGKMCNFGLHKIFRCIYPKEVLPFFMFDDMLKIKYLLILGFWFLGILANFMFLFFYNSEKKFINTKKNRKKCLKVITFLTGLTLCVPYQIAFTCLSTPFILVCFIYHKFFQIFLAFFGIGFFD